MTQTERELAACRASCCGRASTGCGRGWDDKVLADWNGLMIAAMANAGVVFERPEWIDTARRAFDFVRGEMTGADGRLLHGWRAGRARHPANVDDYANLCRAALALHEATGDEGFLSQARDWVAVLDRHYWDEAGGGYFFAAKDTEGLIARAKTAADSAVPAGNGTLVGVLTRLAILTGEEAYRRRAEAIVETFSGEVARNFFPLATLLNNAELLEKPLQIVIVGNARIRCFSRLLRAVYNVSLPNRVVLTLPPGASLPAGHPASRQGSRRWKIRRLCLRGPGLLAARHRSAGTTRRASQRVERKSVASSADLSGLVVRQRSQQTRWRHSSEGVLQPGQSVGVEAEEILADRLEMLLAALHLLRDGVDVAEAALERVLFEDRGRSGGMIGHVDDAHRLVDGEGRGEPDRHPLLEGDMARSLDLAR